MLDLQAVWDLAVAACIKNLCPNTSADCLHLAEASNLKSGLLTGSNIFPPRILPRLLGAI